MCPNRCPDPAKFLLPCELVESAAPTCISPPTAEVLAMSGRVTAGAGGMDIDLSHDIFMGHEFSAEVLEAGPDTETHPAGTLVTSLPVLLSAKGFDRSSSATAPSALRRADAALGSVVAAHPNGLDLRHAALTEPMSVGLHASTSPTSDPGDRSGARLWPDRHRHHRGA